MTAATASTDLAHLRRGRWAIRAALALGVAASVAANVLHAQPTLVGRAIAAWPPLALLLTIELISRVPVHRPALARVRWLATAAISGIAAWTMLAEQGVHERVAQQLAGHADSRVTREVYTHVTARMLDGAVEAIERASQGLYRGDSQRVGPHVGPEAEDEPS